MNHKEFLDKLIEICKRKIKEYESTKFIVSSKKEIQKAYALGVLFYMIDIVESINKDITSLSGEILQRSLLEAATKGILIINDFNLLQSFLFHYDTNQLVSAQYLLKNKKRFQDDLDSQLLPKDISRISSRIQSNKSKGIKKLIEEELQFKKVAELTGIEVYENWYEESYRLLSCIATHLTPLAIINKYIKYEDNDSIIKLLPERNKSLSAKELTKNASCILLIYINELNKGTLIFDSNELKKVSQDYQETFGDIDL
jgi:hypothetical protein